MFLRICGSLLCSVAPELTALFMTANATLTKGTVTVAAGQSHTQPPPPTQQKPQSHSQLCRPPRPSVLTLAPFSALLFFLLCRSRRCHHRRRTLLPHRQRAGLGGRRHPASRVLHPRRRVQVPALLAVHQRGNRVRTVLLSMPTGDAADAGAAMSVACNSPVILSSSQIRIDHIL